MEDKINQKAITFQTQWRSSNVGMKSIPFLSPQVLLKGNLRLVPGM
jgi:hypothetical protein